LPARPQLVAERLRTGRRAPAQQRAHDREPVADGDVAVAEERYRRAPYRRPPPPLVDHGQLEAHPPHPAALADPVEEARVLGETAGGDVLAVVWRRLRVAVAPR